ncbi:hypothetical protein [Microbacterium oxydans]|uniref:hypothetical protein n=1 Tax=Microbacterium oxydans TaxID=82380 RepID=UPI00226B1A84|nr:hypothetical protein [Microbacterium oxydans]WAA66989.1 hypothetical protein MME74_04370 [Microbacterium oxydans]
MNATNRGMNRVLLFCTGAVLLIAGAAALAAGALSTGAAPTWLRGTASAAADVWSSIAGLTWEITGIGSVSVLILIAVAALVLLTLVLIAFLSSRTRGRSKTVLEVDTPGGRTVVDRSVADAVLTAALSSRPDVLSARADAYRVRGTRALELAVVVQPGASLGAVVAAAEGAIREWDALLGARIPILLHLSDRRWRDALRSTTRVR